ncbi:MAG: FtsX-like permease family protein [Bacteroidales bacterium]|nr:FtsX-like permease family protein [Bacteroidales bacterium]
MKSFLKFLSRNKLYTAIEAVGLIVSLAMAILGGCYVWQQEKVAKGDSTWKKYYAVSTSTEEIDYALEGFAEFALDEIPEVENSTLFCPTSISGVVNGHRFPNIPTFEIDARFLEFFPVKWVEGGTAHLGKGEVVVSSSFANEHSPDRSILGTEIQLFGPSGGTVVGVFEDFKRSLFGEVQLICFHEPHPLDGPGRICVVQSSAREEELIPKLMEMIRRHTDTLNSPNSGTVLRWDKVYFSPLNRGRGVLNDGFSKGNHSLVFMLLTVLLLVLISSIFNYVNLNITLAGSRAREMATRTVYGASRRETLLGYIKESLLFTGVCGLLSVLLAYLLAPTLSRYIGGDIPLEMHLGVLLILFVLALTMIIGVICGFISATIVSGFSTIEVLNGTFRYKHKKFFSRLFIVIQSTIAVLLLALSLVMERQMSHMLRRPLGFDAEDVYHMHTFGLNDEILALSGINDYAYGSAPITSNGIDLQSVTFYVMDEKAFRMLGFNIIEDWHTPQELGIWLTESAARSLNVSLNRPTHPMLEGPDMEGAHFAGIIGDFALSDAAHIDPAAIGAIMILPYDSDLLLKVSDRDVVPILEEKYREICTRAYGFVWNEEQNGFITDKLEEGLGEAKCYMRMLECFMILALLLSLLGLFAMSAYYADEKAHDIAVKKVFGGSIRSEMLNAVALYMVLVGTSCLLAIPFAVWLSGRFLERFSYRIEGYWWIFAVAAILVLLASFVAVFWQTLRAARTDPAVELKKE